MGCLKLTYYPETSPLKVVKDFSFSVEKSGVGAYRYGFNGKELDRDEEGMGGGGSTYDYGFRIYNPALAKFLSVDPLLAQYPWYTPYQFAGNSPIRYIDLDGLEEADPQKKQAALNKIEEFKKTNSSTVWNSISKEEFIAKLTEIVNNPSLLKQAGTNLCGITTTCKLIATFDPESFVQMAIDLYTTGETTSKDKNKKIVSNKDLFNSAPTNGLNALTYVLMTSMRDSQNGMLDYDPNNDSGPSGMTTPADIVELINDFTNIKILSKGSQPDDVYNHINKTISEGSCIIALFDWHQVRTQKDNIRSLLHGIWNSKDGFLKFEYHWVQIKSLSKVSKDGHVNYKMGYWNPNSSKIENKELAINTFKGSLYYYIVIKQ
jgi:RHS repeat-associated protein